MSADSPASESALELRRAFDESFSKPPREERGLSIVLLMIRVSGQPFALRMTQVAGLFDDRRVTALPGTLPHFLGVASLQGRLVAVHDLAGLLGHEPAARPRWLVRLPHASLALAFDAFEGQFVAAEQDLAEVTAGDARYAHRAVRTPPILRPIVDLEAVAAAIRSRIVPQGPLKER